MSHVADAFWRNETSPLAALWSVKADVLCALFLLTLAFEIGPVHWAFQGLVEIALGEVGEPPETDFVDWVLTGAIAAVGFYHVWKAIRGFVSRNGARQEVNAANVENHATLGTFRIPVAFVTKVEKSWTPFGSTIHIVSKGADKPFEIHGARKADAAIDAIKRLNKLI